ncbi:unnamed protein product [Symbiodinium sp. CCMP2592]|nr:unnamed protein product [Symbiodinium sp. KB8]CAE7535429.1 unnamed protein product [Symbiodinium sp. CCMP2592]CAE7860591.1 unnamed protein product [Symbiodinium microadriaticum]|mmetsp:Transcript_62023/g.145499  ORF Transcript_62023/g.145499 Transcript_62023/m.145499 type:complete len:128 (-) Transcript_62023:119-502(-)
MARRVFRPMMLPLAMLQAFFMMALSGLWLWLFGVFWTFMVIELPKDLGPYSQMSSLSMFLMRAFPMKETNDVSYEFKFDHVLILACVFVIMMMGWAPTRTEIEEEDDKELAKANKKTKAKKLAKALS